ncbi:hypothetical protein L914_17573 [Phytophthora nicotianae]|uniref:MULE transposase domain-containing protein n=1 Tax=Phytophthora nicotianae TaxID=4792 RepID=W2MGQ9_PHYNI|nr:hypothetical protein L914_17573 [Phytophthora nicotianae]
MADAEVAQQNAVTRVFGVDCELVYWMCFYHVMAKVYEKLKVVPEHLSKEVMAGIYDLNFADSQDVFDEQVKQILTKWLDEEQLIWFQGYLERTWMMSSFWRWQCFHTPRDTPPQTTRRSSSTV